MSLTSLITVSILVVYCISDCLAEDNCTVPAEPRFRGFIRGQKRKYPSADVETALMDYPEIDDILKYEEKTLDDSDPRSGNDVADTDWNEMCPFKATNLQHYGIKQNKKKCWVLSSLWMKQCAKKTCQYTFSDKLYYQCRPYYVSIQFWAYCPTHADGPFMLLVRDVPRHCICRRYFCGDEGHITPVKSLGN